MDAWRKNAIVYCVDTKTWLDSERRHLPIGPYGYRWLRPQDDGAGTI